MPDIGGLMGSTLATTGIILLISGIFTVVLIVFILRYTRKMSGRSKEAQQIAQTGVPGQARILNVQQTGTYINRNPVVDILVEVHPQTGQPYQTNVRRLVSMFQISQFQQGAVVPVRIDQTDPTKVVILV